MRPSGHAGRRRLTTLALRAVLSAGSQKPLHALYDTGDAQRSTSNTASPSSASESMDRPSVPFPIACARVKLRRTWTDVRLFWTANWRFLPSSMSLTPTEVFVTSISFSLTRLRWYIRTLHVDEPSILGSS